MTESRLPEQPGRRQLSALDQLRWYVRRLAAMSPLEILHRVGEAMRKRSGRRMSGSWTHSTGDALFFPPHIAAKFAPERLSDPLQQAVLTEAGAICAGQFTLLGCAWPQQAQWPPAAGFWHSGPDEPPQASADARYCFDVFAEARRRGRDVKRIWEISRLQFLLPVAVASRLTGDGEMRRWIWTTLEAWMSANPPYSGLGYASGIELALRSLSVCLTAAALGPDSLSAQERAALATCLQAHEQWLARFPSLHSSANNHLIAELAALLVCRIVNNAPPAETRSAVARLADALAAQFHADGVGAEQAPTYAAFSVELALVAFAFAGVAPADVPGQLRDRLRVFAEFSQWSMDCNGVAPEVGDNDGGRVIMLQQAQEPRYLASVTAMLAAWLGEPGLAPPARAPHLRDLLFGSADQGQSAPDGFRIWRSGGYSIWRAKNPTVQLMLDHGPLGHLSIAAHGHADALALWLHVDGTPVFVDAGTVTYTGVDPRRDMFRTTPMHNTLSIGDESSSRIAGPFNWSHKAATDIESADGSAGRVAASHDGYRASHGIIVHRAVERSDNRDFLVTDRISGNAGTVCIGFLLGPDIEAQADGDCWLLRRKSDYRPLVRLCSQGPLRAAIEAGAKAQTPALVARHYGAALETARLTLRGRLGPKETQMTRLTILP